jgi:hypothetical protein
VGHQRQGGSSVSRGAGAIESRIADLIAGTRDRGLSVAELADWGPEVSVGQQADKAQSFATSGVGGLCGKTRKMTGHEKSRFHAPKLIPHGNRHDKAHGRATRGKIAHAAEPLPNFPSRSSVAV